MRGKYSRYDEEDVKHVDRLRRMGLSSGVIQTRMGIDDRTYRRLVGRIR